MRTSAGKPLSMSELREVIGTIIRSDPTRISADANLAQIGLDSIGSLRLLNHLRQNGTRVSYRELAMQPTLTDLQRYLAVRGPHTDQSSA